ncbi:MAG: DUF5615 family PIN-like protein [Gammaproteobacteria bacterium]
MKLLLDENFPLPLYHELGAAGYDVEHIIVLGQRGLPDAVIRQRLALEEIVFLTIPSPWTFSSAQSTGSRRITRTCAPARPSPEGVVCACVISWHPV